MTTDLLQEQLVSPPSATRAERFAARVIQAGCIAVVLAAVTWREYELDRFFVPKELVLHATALLAGGAVLRRLPRLEFRLVDVLFCVFVLLSAISALLSQNGWLAFRALAVSASGVLLFWTARVLAQAGLGGRIVHAAALAAAIGVGTAVLQTYGVRTDIFSINRAPGGTLGNRNFIAHMAAFGLPLMMLVALRTRSHIRFLAAAVGAMLLIAMLVLTRSRAGILALGAALLVLAAAVAYAPVLRRSVRIWTRLAVMLIIAGAGIVAAVITPNSLRWRGDNPYMESIAGVANYQEGSGRGRLVQYRQTSRMAVAHPLLGVGPGNWAVEYPQFAAANDPSLDRSTGGMTSNPWPSSDWMAFVSERGVMATLALVIALLAVAVDGFRSARRQDMMEDALAGAALPAMIFAAAVAGTFDAVLLLALPTLLVFASAGALWRPSTQDGMLRVGAPLRVAAAAIMVFMAFGGTLRSSAQLGAMGVHANSGNVRALALAARIDPGNYRLRLRLARSGSGLSRQERCRHALAAADLYPEAREARNLARGCS